MKTGPSPEKKRPKKSSFIRREDSSSCILLQQVATTRKKPGVCSTPTLREHTTTSMFDEVRGDTGGKENSHFISMNLSDFYACTLV